MRTLVMLALACAAGCDQLASSGTIAETETTTDEAAAATVTSRPPASRVRWMTAHDGVSLSSVGVVALVPDDGPAVDVIHARLTLTAQAGTLAGDASTAALEGFGRTTLHPVAVNGTVTTLPLALVDPNASQVVDLFFALPRPPASSLVFAWTVTTQRGPLALRALLALDGDAATEKLSLAGSRWWFSAAPAWSTFRHRDGVITVRPPTGAAVEKLSYERDDGPPNPCDQW
jgi:hypothetical protein